MGEKKGREGEMSRRRKWRGRTNIRENGRRGGRQKERKCKKVEKENGNEGE